MRFRRTRSLLAAAPLLLAPLACGEDPFEPVATFRIIGDTLTAFALTGTPLSAPTALNTIAHAVVRADPLLEFDVVFDIDQNGQALLYPGQLIGGGANAGIRKSTQAFDDIRFAPQTGYTKSRPTEIAAGDVLLIRTQPSTCAGSILSDVFAKLVIDSINVQARTFHFRMRVDPNCGFRDLTRGVPDR